MDGIETAPGHVTIDNPSAAERMLSKIGRPILTGVSILLLLYYLISRFLWLYNMSTDAAEEAEASPSSSPRAPSSPLPISRPCHAVPLSLLSVFVPVASSTSKEKVERAVCLAAFGEREAGWLLPRCGHGFHEECIAMWLQVHTTCPLCRAPVATM